MPQSGHDHQPDDRDAGGGVLAAFDRHERIFGAVDQPMIFTKRLHGPIKRGEVTCTIRIWKSPRVKVGGRYALGEGFVEVKKIRQIALADITPDLARRSGFAGVVDLLKVAKHGSGENVYLIDFAYKAA